MGGRLTQHSWDLMIAAQTQEIDKDHESGLLGTCAPTREDAEFARACLADIRAFYQNVNYIKEYSK